MHRPITYTFVALLALLGSPIIAAAHEGHVHSEVSASANTGGNVVGSGGTVTTGEATASASVYTNVSGSNGGSSVDITMTTSENGVTYTEKRHEDIPAGESVSIVVATSSSSSHKTSVAAPAQTNSVNSGNASAEASASLSAEVVAERIASTTEETLLAAVSATDELLPTHWFSGLYQSIRSFVGNLFAALSFSS